MYISKKVTHNSPAAARRVFADGKLIFIEYHIQLSALSLCGATEFMTNEWRNDRARSRRAFLIFYCISQNQLILPARGERNRAHYVATHRKELTAKRRKNRDRLLTERKRDGNLYFA